MATVGTDSYVTEAQYQAYADSRGISVNLGSIDADLILSADFIDTYYNFKGSAISYYTTPSAHIEQVAQSTRLEYVAQSTHLEYTNRSTHIEWRA